MNCYQCGAPSHPEQKFCRSCGTSLQIITRPLAESTAVGDLEKNAASIPKVTRQWTRNLMLGGFVTMFIGLFLAVVGATMIHDKMITGVGMLHFLLGMFLMGFAEIWRKTRPRPVSNPQPETLTPSQPIMYLPQESRIEQPTSITDRTTSLLPHPAATNPRQRESGELQS